MSWIVICHSFPKLLQEHLLASSLSFDTNFRRQPLQFIQRLLDFKWGMLTSRKVNRQVMGQTGVIKRLEVERKVHSLVNTLAWMGSGAVTAA